MSHWRSGTFWASAILAWFVVQFASLLLFAIVITDETDEKVAGLVLLALVAVPLLAGHAHGKHQVRLQDRKIRGFPVITKDD